MTAPTFRRNGELHRIQRALVLAPFTVNKPLLCWKISCFKTEEKHKCAGRWNLPKSQKLLILNVNADK